MVFNTEPHLSRVRNLLRSGDQYSLRYACLELRFAIERITYQKLQLRLGKIDIDEIGAWQPRRAMERLMELVDDKLKSDSTLMFALENSEGEVAGEFKVLGKNKGVNPKELGKHWQKLGSYLHVPAPRKKGDEHYEPDSAGLANYIFSVLRYIEELTSTQFDAYFSEDVFFSCDKCSQAVVRNANLLKNNDIVQCQNPNCNASYVTMYEEDTYKFQRYRLHFDCCKCHQRNFIEANSLLKLEYHQVQIVTCASCRARYHARWELRLQPEESVEK